MSPPDPRFLLLMNVCVTLDLPPLRTLRAWKILEGKSVYLRSRCLPQLARNLYRWVIPYYLSLTSASLSLPLTPMPPPIMSASRSRSQLTLHHVVIALCITSGDRMSKGVAQAVIVLPGFPPHSLA
ncbi:hypothetical protein C8R44DRAFT_747217 [Mycena epipterygia]|nr:hypothetical protein C8R44DRAFT_747217 [Mycena epipterygia]